MDRAVITTPMGNLEILGNHKGITAVTFVDQPSTASTSMAEPLHRAKEQLQEYFDKNRQTFELDLAPEGTEFQKRVWNELAQVPYGHTVSYMEIAKRLGDPKVIRAAASANGKNPIAIIIPCHRIIGSDGSLTGYAAGLDRKKQLLELESNYIQGRLF